jgi:arylsulfatase
MQTLSRRNLLKLGGGLLAGAALARVPLAGAAEDKTKKPNIILILADDLGYSDLGCYGGEIATPNLDALAGGGLRFTEFYNSARCCPSRASIMTGLYPHQAGIGEMTNDRGPQFPGYRGRLSEHCVTLAEALRPAGYQTFCSGKWHMNTPGPLLRGFDEYFGFKDRGAHSVHSWNEQAFLRLPEGRPTRQYAPGTFYATDAITDYALDFIAGARRQPSRPYFLYLAYNAPHFPLQAPKELIDKYQKVYEQGWDAIRERRYERLKKLGLIDDRWPLSPRSEVPPNTVAAAHNWAGKQNPAWETIDPARRTDLARRMATYAAMVDRMDQNIGRVLADLKRSGELENTLIFFLSDNGACAEWDPWGFDGDSGPKNVLHTGAELEKMGQPGSYFSFGSGWANTCNTPFRLYKHYTHEGGISTPLIVHWPAGMKRQGEIDARPGHIIDLMPTCLEAAGARYPKQFKGKAILPAEGESLVAALRGAPARERTIYFEHEGNRAVRQGKWKLVALRGGEWELYDEDADRTEQKNLAAREPERVKAMAAQWDAWAKRCNVGFDFKNKAVPGPRV